METLWENVQSQLEQNYINELYVFKVSIKNIRATANKTLCTILYNLYVLKNVKNTRGVIFLLTLLLKLTFLHG